MIKRSVTVSFIFTALLCISANVLAQTQGQVYKEYTGIKVFANSKAMLNPWAGGYNNPQFSLADLNNDGKQDLVIYERGGYQVRTFINTGVAGNPVYVYEPKYQKNFPEVVDYLVLKDYNDDNIPDLFHRGQVGFTVYKGAYQNNELTFTYYRELRYNGFAGNTTAYVTPNSDLPAIVDVDYDGDLDFLAFDNAGGYIFWYRNCREEDNLPNDSIRVCLKSNCWGKIYQPYSRTHYYNVCNAIEQPSCKGCPQPKATLHTGNALCLLDIDGDNDYDILNGNLSFSDIQFLKNGRSEFGLLIDSIYAQDTVWGANGTDVHLPQMPAAFWLDIDQDTDKDLLIAPMADNTSENYKCILHYKNTGTDANPNFVYQNDSIFVKDDIDLGRAAYPVFYDYNKDSKPDLIVGSDGYFQPGGTLQSRLSLYINTSTPGNPSFNLFSDDFLGLGSANIEGAAPAVGDIDNDGKDDLLLGRADGTVTFFKNTAASNTVQPVWSLYAIAIKDNTNKIIDAGGGYAAPFIYDINKDGEKDLVLGHATGGTLIYYENGGTAGQIDMAFITAKLGNMVMEDSNIAAAYTVPYIGRVDNTPYDYFLVGTGSGKIYRYYGAGDGNYNKTFDRVDSMYSYISAPYTYASQTRTAPAVADIDGDGKYEMAVGNILGGINIYKQDLNVTFNAVAGIAKPSFEVNMYPNPANRNVVFMISNANLIQEKIKIGIYSVVGQKMLFTEQKLISGGKIDVDISSLASGSYYCIVEVEGEIVAKQLSVVK